MYVYLCGNVKWALEFLDEGFYEANRIRREEKEEEGRSRVHVRVSMEG